MKIIRTKTIPTTYRVPHLSDKWWDLIESVEANAAPEQSFLVRRHYDNLNSQVIICDYVTVKEEQEGQWKHMVAIYFQGEPTPYPPIYDGNRYHLAPRRLMNRLVQSTAGRIFLQQE